MDYFNNHSRLFLTALGLFLSLTILVAIIPALTNQNNNALLPGYVLPSDDEKAGKALFISNGCVGCHTQQVRDVAMDQQWGSRPGIPADYAGDQRQDIWRNTATLMGTERTGPDLTNIGNRQPGADWNLLHLYQPRAVNKQSIMPAYPWLFEQKEKVSLGDVAVNVPSPYIPAGGGKIIVARKEAMQLLAYLQSLKQISLNFDTTQIARFLYNKTGQLAKNAVKDPDAMGLGIFQTNCMSCHQADGQGLKGAFPPLKGSPVVLDDNPEKMITIIMKGYSGRPGFGVMPPVGTNANFTADQISALINHERNSWGNKGRKIPVAEVQKILDLIKTSK